MTNAWRTITGEKFDVMIKTGINFEPKGWTGRGCPESERLCRLWTVQSVQSLNDFQQIELDI